MKPLEKIQEWFIWLSIHPPDESSSNRQKRGYNIFALAAFTIQFISFLGSLTYCWKFFSVDLEKCLFAFMTVTALIGSLYTIIVGVFVLRPKMNDIFEDLSIIYENHEKETSFRFLAQANKTCEWISQIYIKYSIGAISNFGLMCLISVLYCWFNDGHLNVANFYHQFTLVLLWNQTTLLGYFGECVCVMSFGLEYLCVTGAFLILFISLSLHHQVFHKMFKHKIDELKQSEDSECNEEFLCDLTRFHISIKEWFLDSAQVYSSIAMVQLICTVIMMAVSIFFLDLQTQKVDFIMVNVMAALSYGLLTAFMYCYFGSKASESYEKMGETIFELDWYKLPVNKQNDLILMAANMQKPMHFHSFGVLHLNLEAFTSLIRAAYSYYMAFKTIASN